jgi:hypothetical protein
MTIIAPDGPAAPPAASSGVVPAGPERAQAALPEPVVPAGGRLVPGAAVTDGVDVEAVVAAIRRAHPDVPLGVVRAAVDRAVWSFRGARIAHYLPVLIERQVRLQLRPGAG